MSYKAFVLYGKIGHEIQENYFILKNLHAFSFNVVVQQDFFLVTCLKLLVLSVVIQ